MDPKKIFPLKIASLCCFFTMLYALFGFQGIGNVWAASTAELISGYQVPAALKRAPARAPARAGGQGAYFSLMMNFIDRQTNLTLYGTDLVIRSAGQQWRYKIGDAGIVPIIFYGAQEYIIDITKEGYYPLSSYKFKIDSPKAPIYVLKVLFGKVPTGGITFLLLDEATQNVVKANQSAGTVRIQWADGEQSRQVNPNEPAAVFYNLPHGVYRYRVDIPAYQSAEGSVQLAEQMNTTRVVLKPGAAKQQVRVTDDRGAPIAGAVIIVQGAGKPTSRAQTDPNGRATFNLSSGGYTFTASANGHHPVVTQLIQMPSGKELDIQLIAVKPVLTIAVVDPGGKPVVGANVVLYYRARSGFRSKTRQMQVRTDVGGNARFYTIPNGSMWRATITAPGFRAYYDHQVTPAGTRRYVLQSGV